MQPQNLVRGLQHLVTMGYQDPGDIKLRNGINDTFFGDSVKATGRFVQQKYFGFAIKRPCEQDALYLSL